MKRMISVALLASLFLLPATELRAQGEPTGQKTLAATMNVFVFPTEGQDAARQSQDEAACYQWAVQNTGTDPFSLAKQAEADKAKTDQAKQQAAQAQATARAEQQGQQAQAATAEQITNFKKAFSVCLEAKDYMVKF